MKLFRRIRESLLAEGKTSKYLKYAIGEIVLVVIGILIALKINNWNELQKEKSQTAIYVQNLIDDLNKDIFKFDDAVKSARQKYQFCKEINAVIIEGKPIIDTSAFVIELQAVGRLLIPAITDNTYKDLISTGNLKLINDKNSIDAIRDYYSSMPNWWFDDYKNQLVNGYLPLAVDAIPMHLHEEILENEILSATQDFTDNVLLNNKVKNYTASDILEIRNALEGNKDFAFQLKRITRSHLVHAKILGLTKTNAITMIEKLKNWKK